MTPEGDKRKYDVTLVETIIHTFTIETEDGDDPYEAAEEIFLNSLPSLLENHGESIKHREVENVTPQ